MPLEAPLDKPRLRKEAAARRAAVTERTQRSRAIAERVRDLPEYAAAATVLCYVSIRSEVETRDLLEFIFADGKTAVVPRCFGDVLRLFRLGSLDELVPGNFGILEPPLAWDAEPGRGVAPAEVDLALLPGLAFDRRGGRLGYGKGHFDRLFAHRRPGQVLAALAFEAQLTDSLPLEPHDIPLDLLITEAAVLRPGAPADLP